MTEKLEVSSIQAEDTPESTGDKWRKVRRHTTEMQKGEVEAEKAAGVESQDSPVEQSSSLADSEAIINDNLRLREENKKLEETIQYLRADAQNTDRRHRETVEKARKYAATDAIQALLPLWDSVYAAEESEHFGTGDKGAGEQNIKDLMSTIFVRLGVTVIDPALAVAFDPYLHSAVGREELKDSTQAPNTVVKVLRKGCQLHDRVLRPAMVIISSLKDPLIGGVK